MTGSTTDRIEKEILLKAPQPRVWKALADPHEFGTWFRMELDGVFAPGRRLTGRITHPGYEHVRLELRVERMEPEHHLSYRWHPGAVDTTRDYSQEPMTLVEFWLEAVEGGTRLKVVESGFDQLPPGRREEAFRMNEGGWKGQLVNIQRHVEA
jgi:uncharacterized protein YndB with AHSA1/START domain